MFLLVLKDKCFWNMLSILRAFTFDEIYGKDAATYSINRYLYA
jgi:hypothetical protein